MEFSFTKKNACSDGKVYKIIETCRVVARFQCRLSLIRDELKIKTNWHVSLFLILHYSDYTCLYIHTYIQRKIL